MRFLVLASALIFLTVARADTNPQGLEIVGKVFRQFLKSQPGDLKLGDGVHVVSTRGENDARANSDDGTVMGALQNYLGGHEVRIRLQELMPDEGFGKAFKTAMDEMEGKNDSTGRAGGGGGGGGGGGKKGDGGGTGIMLMGLMMGKMLAALGIGGVGLLAMKALMVSALALMLSVIIGLKKLVHTDHDEGHTVIHAGHGHGHEYRRKREATDMAYRAWEELKAREELKTR